MTSWIDGSFIYSTSEAWIAAMRSFVNGTFRSDNTGRLPPRNTERVPLSNAPSPHVLRMLSPERMFCKWEIQKYCRFCTHFYIALCALYDAPYLVWPFLLINCSFDSIVRSALTCRKHLRKRIFVDKKLRIKISTKCTLVTETSGSKNKWSFESLSKIQVKPNQLHLKVVLPSWKRR